MGSAGSELRVPPVDEGEEEAGHLWENFHPSWAWWPGGLTDVVAC
jgi:hypothetical protein